MSITTYNWTKEVESTSTSFDSWIATQGFAYKSLFIGTDVTVTGNLTIPQNIDIITIANNAKFTGSGKTLTINKMSAQPRHQIFGIGLNVIFGSGAVSCVLPEWFGSGNGNILIGTGVYTPLSRIYVETGGISIGTNVTAGSGNLVAAGSGSFTGVVHGGTPTVSTHLTTKLYVDAASGALNTYISDSSGQLNTRINATGLYAANVSGQLNTYITNTSGQLSGVIQTHSDLTIHAHGEIASGNHNHGLGTSGYIPVYNSASGFINSIIYQSGSQIDINGSFKASVSGTFGDGVTNYSKFDSNGFYTSYGSGMSWDDIRIPGLSVKLGSNAPDLITFVGSGLECLGFDGNNTMEQVFFSCQLPHSYQLNSILHPHIHWSPSTNETGNVKWLLEYSWTDINGIFTGPTTISGIGSTEDNQWKHIYTDFPDISGAGSGMSSMLMCRLYRRPTDSDDTYDGDAAFLEFDFHYIKDTYGSQNETSK